MLINTHNLGCSFRCFVKLIPQQLLTEENPSTCQSYWHVVLLKKFALAPNSHNFIMLSLSKLVLCIKVSSSSIAVLILSNAKVLESSIQVKRFLTSKDTRENPSGTMKFCRQLITSFVFLKFLFCFI